MRVLLAHEFYRSSAPSGEDAVFQNERQMLRNAGIDLVDYEVHNDLIDASTIGKRIRLGLSTIWSRRAYEEIRALIRSQRPELAHFHNTFPLISPAAYKACRDEDIPVVQTLHNYRMICPGALLQRDGQPCERCLDGSLLNSLRYRCYRDSLLATLPLTAMIGVNRANGAYHHWVDRYIALTDFAASRMTRGGIPADRLVAKPNFLPDPPSPGNGEGGFAIYVGRLSQEKGVRTLLQAWREVPDLGLKVLGDGPLRQSLESEFGTDSRIEFLGSVSRERVLELVGNAVVQLVPSEWYEGFPMVVLEAFASGTPVIASDIGSLAEVITPERTGLLFAPGNPQSCAQVVNAFLAGHHPAITRAGVREEFDTRYTEGTNLKILLGIYGQLLD